MAALCPGVQYGLSSQQNYGENRDLIFVKLTDSALRAIEEYLKNQNKFYNHKPTIKFLGNENGELSFPSQHHSSGSTSFSFSMSSTADMEGQGGSFECIKQVGSPRGPLEGLGSIPYKIRIHANDDVYEVTRNRMTEAEDKYKNKCTREIKPNQTDIGRKVKVKQNRAPLHPVRREMPSMRESLMKQPSQPYHHQPKPSIPPPSAPPPPSAIVHSSTNGHLSNGLGSNHVSSSRPQLNLAKKLSVPELPRRPPNSPISNRKPQTLTPPGGGSDGGSSGSGQSPTSTLPGSPPLISTSTANKRPGFHEGPDGIPYKRQRIAHIAPAPKSHNNTHHSDPIYHPPVEINSQRRPVTDSRDASNMNPRSRESPTGGGGGGGGGGVSGGGTAVSGYGLVNGHNTYNNNIMTLDVKQESSDEEDEVGKRACDSHFDVSQEKTFVDSRSLSPAVKMLQVDKWEREKSREKSNERQNGALNRIINGVPRNNHLPRQQNAIPPVGHKVAKYTNVTSSTENSIARVSPDSQTEGLSNGDVDNNFSTEKENEYPDYKKQYVTIQDADQRRKYKAEFNADYMEYRDLHSIVEKVSRRFAQLEERLKKEDENSPKYKDIKKQIVREYNENKKNMEHQRAKRRFQYLHDKLSHIKRLVMEYDQEMTESRY